MKLNQREKQKFYFENLKFFTLTYLGHIYTSQMSVY